ncbi:hypothetical protein A5764_21600 [Mycobacterium sp. 852002-51057_SCH5723018]|nr:hypothetical protein A5764_21600 [Mycobacterium sp. 852002-51057_SCH5723018]
MFVKLRNATQVSLATVKGPPVCHEHGTGVARSQAVLMVTWRWVVRQLGVARVVGQLLSVNPYGAASPGTSPPRPVKASKTSVP